MFQYYFFFPDIDSDTSALGISCYQGTDPARFQKFLLRFAKLVCSDAIMVIKILHRGKLFAGKT